MQVAFFFFSLKHPENCRVQVLFQTLEKLLKMQKVDFLETKRPLPNLFVLVADDTLVQRRSGATTLLTSSKMEITSTSA